MNKEIRNIIKSYKELKADIVDIDIRIKELEGEMLGITAMPQGDRISPTYKITSQVEIQAEHHQEDLDKLLYAKFKKENEVKRIDNALNVLDETHREVIKEILINNKRYSYMQEKLHLTYRAIKEMEYGALRKMERYVC